MEVKASLLGSGQFAILQKYTHSREDGEQGLVVPFPPLFVDEPILPHLTPVIKS